MRRVIAILPTLAAVGIGWLVWDGLGTLRGSVLWDLRHLVFLGIVFALLTGAEQLAAWLSRRR